MTKGTPKNLLQAIQYGSENAVGAEHQDTRNRIIELYVQDFIRQKLCVLMISSDPHEVKAALKMKDLLVGAKYED